MISKQIPSFIPAYARMEAAIRNFLTGQDFQMRQIAAAVHSASTKLENFTGESMASHSAFMGSTIATQTHISEQLSYTGMIVFLTRISIPWFFAIALVA
jgi:hypothetical protein